VVPMVNYAPLVEVTSDKADYEKFDRRVAQGISTNQQKLRSPGRLPGVPEGEGRPGPAHAWILPRRAAEGVGLPGRQQGDQRPGGAVGGRPGTAGEEAYFNRLLTRTHQLPDRAATYCLQMCGVLTEEERALKERDGSIVAQARGTCPGCHTADPRPRHELPESGVDQDHEARHLTRRQVQGDRCGCHPAPPDGCLLQREGQEVQGRDAPDHLRDRRLPPPQVQEAPRGAPRGRREALCPGRLRHRLHGCKGERAPDGADQTRPGRKPGHPERPSPVILLLTTE
ncbi:Hypothetical protein DHA2_153600, partial [Giardia duodenalis]